MTVVELHPEDLLDKDARDALSEDERVRLDAHLARCSVCRAERVLRADFADELQGDDPTPALLGLVQGALAAPVIEATGSAPDETPVDEQRAPSPESAPEIVAVGRLRRRPRRTAVFLLVAAAVLGAGAAGATGLTGRVWLRLGGGGQETTHSSARPSEVEAPRAATRGRPASSVAAAVPVATADVTAALPIEPPLVIDPPSLAPTPALAPTLRVMSAPQPPPRAAAVAPSPAPGPRAVAAPPAPTSASGLFESANTARRAGDARTALARYDALGEQFPGTREARVAKATAGRLLLDRGDAAGALARFDAYLASGSSELREEAMAGRATALARLGREDDEARAWGALLAAYPSTPYAAHARARVGRSLPR